MSESERDHELENLLSRGYHKMNDSIRRLHQMQPVAIAGRNDACPCNSGKKAKKCCKTPAFEDCRNKIVSRIHQFDAILRS